MSKRPLIYEITDKEGNVIYASTDKREAMTHCSHLLLDNPAETYEFIVVGGNKKTLFAFCGIGLTELLEDEQIDG